MLPVIFSVERDVCIYDSVRPLVACVHDNSESYVYL